MGVARFKLHFGQEAQGAGAGFLLLENGEYLLLEDGSRLIL